MKEMTRRSFVGFCTTCAAFAGIGGAATALGGNEELLRPPGAQDEARLISTCVKCDRCRSVCPTNVISVAHVEDGVLNARTPKLDFHKGYCDFCGLCEKVCATGSITSFNEEEEKIGMAIIQKDRCIAYFQGCIECEKACPFEAITLDKNGHPLVDAEKCNGCGLCEYICPALVYRSFSGGTRRGVVVVSPEHYERIGKTLVEDDSEMSV